MKSVVIGLGDFGYAAARLLAQNGVEVIAIDVDMELVKSIRDDVSLAVCLDATKQDALAAQGVGGADVLIAAVGSNFEAQVLAVVHAKRLGVAHVIARAVTRTHAEILREVGADRVLNPEEEAAKRLVQRLMIPNIAEYFELAEGFSVVEVVAPDGTHGRTLRELELRPKYRMNIVGIKHPRPVEEGEEPAYDFDPVPDPEGRIEPGDVLAVVGSDLDIARFTSELGG